MGRTGGDTGVVIGMAPVGVRVEQAPVGGPDTLPSPFVFAGGPGGSEPFDLVSALAAFESPVGIELVVDRGSTGLLLLNNAGPNGTWLADTGGGGLYMQSMTLGPAPAGTAQIDALDKVTVSAGSFAVTTGNQYRGGGITLTDTSTSGIQVVSEGSGGLLLSSSGGQTLIEGTGTEPLQLLAGANGIDISANGGGGVTIVGDGIELSGGGGFITIPAFSANPSIYIETNGAGGTITMVASQEIIIQGQATSPPSISLDSGGILFDANGFALDIGVTGDKLGFLGAVAVARQTLTGAKGGNVALTNLVALLATIGLLTDSTT